MDISAIALQGLHQSEIKLEKAATRIASFGAEPADNTDVDTVDLSAEVVALMSAKNEFSVDLKILNTADEMQSDLGDLLGSKDPVR